MRLLSGFPDAVLVAVSFLFVGCLSPDARSGLASFAEGEEVEVKGRAVEIDVTPMFVDGDGLLSVETERYGTVLVLIPARERLCEAEGLQALHSLRPGDRVAARGRVTAGGALEVCAARSHFLAAPARSGSPASTLENPRSDQQEIQAREKAFFEAFSERDLDGVIAFFGEDSLLQIAGMPPVEGREAIRDFYGNLFRFMAMSSPDPQRARVSAGGDLAYTMGQVVNRFDAEQGLREYEGKYLVIWEREDGEWQIVIYNVSGNE